MVVILEAIIYGATDAPVAVKPAIAASSPQIKASSCYCNWTTTWVDIMVVLDASSASGQDNLNEMWDIASTALSWLTVTNTTDPVTTNYTSRVGIVTYGNTATVYRPLGSVNNDDLYDIFTVPFNNENVTNLEAGIQAAAVELYGSAYRSNTQQVMIVFATTFNTHGSYPPQQAAQAFIASGGIIMVYNHVSQHGIPIVDPTLKSIASPEYFFTNLNTSFVPTDLDDAICDANCFCPNYYFSFIDSPRQTPTAGCYQAVTAPANYLSASNRCTLSNNGFLAFDESYNKTVFLGQQFLNSPINFWIGLTWNEISYRWEWADGTSLGSYQPWAGGSTPIGSRSLACVYVNYNNQWVATDCRNGFVYACETSPCDSLHYCP